MPSDDGRFEKGFFTRRRLPVSEKHVRETGRWRLFVAGAAATVVLATVFLGDAFLGRATTVAQGPLSESHALFGSDCATCHTATQGVQNASCEACHEKFGSPIGAYSFTQHYLYRSGDPDRSAPSTSELTCAACHQEHQGRTADLLSVSNATCQSCHDVQSFPDRHPEFEFAAQDIPDPANLKFTHVHHVSEVMDEYDLVDVEAACLTCHVPEPSGRSFQPISFDTQCDACHLSESSSTPYLPIAAGGEATPGVETLAQIRTSGAPGTLWAEFWNPNEFRERGGQVQKRPLYHEDPWVLYNLREIRRALFPGAELADLLTTSADVDLADARVLPEEAIATLRDRIGALQGSPSRDVQDELDRLNELLDGLEGRISDPFSTIDANRYQVRIVDRASGLTSPEAYLALADSLTVECQTCHVVENATLKRVQTDQKTLIRAEFDHRAHITHAHCLDCHSAIPVREALASGEDVPPELDRAEIQNLPTIQTCATCHTGQAATTECTSCHLFHPDKSHWANLSRYEAREP